MTANLSQPGEPPKLIHALVADHDSEQKPRGRAKSPTLQRILPAGLLLLSAIPIISGILRLVELAGGAQITPANARFFTSPTPVVFHIVGAVLYAVLGAFQFSAGVRRRWPGWHRQVGRVLALCGLVVALSGLWMTIFYPLPEIDGDLLYFLRLVFGSGMVLSIVLGYKAAQRRQFKRHGAWMKRAYAIGLGAGTQAFVLMVGEMVSGPPTELSRALLMGAGWAINLAVAEWSIRRGSMPRTRRPSRAVPLLTETLDEI